MDNTKLKETTSKRIKELRIKNKLTMEVLAEKIGVSKSTIAKWENGYVENMRQDNILKLSLLFNVPATYIMGYDEPDDIDMVAEECEYKSAKKSYLLTADQIAFLSSYAQLPPAQRELIDNMLKTLTSKL